jgi:hypothetical protein
MLAAAALTLGLAACGTSAPQSQSTTSTTSKSPPSAGTSTSSSTTLPGPRPCATAQLSVTPGLSSGAAGTIGQIILFENSSSSPCLLHGFPGVAGLDNSGHQVVQATRALNGAPISGSASSLPTVQLAPGDMASALVLSSDVPEGSATTCSTYAALLVTPPNAFQSVRVNASLPGCAGLRVGPVYRGTTGQA